MPICSNMITNKSYTELTTNHNYGNSIVKMSIVKIVHHHLLDFWMENG